MPAGSYQDAILIKEYSEAPGSIAEFKWHAPGVGVVKTHARNGQLVLIAGSLGTPAGGGIHVAGPPVPIR